MVGEHHRRNGPRHGNNLTFPVDHSRHGIRGQRSRFYNEGITRLQNAGTPPSRCKIFFFPSRPCQDVTRPCAFGLFPMGTCDQSEISRKDTTYWHKNFCTQRHAISLDLGIWYVPSQKAKPSQRVAACKNASRGEKAYQKAYIIAPNSTFVSFICIEA